MTSPSRVTPLLVPIIISLLITGCIGNEMNDLHNYIEEIKARQPRAIEPLPKIQQIETFVYEAKSRRDPFSTEFGVDNLSEREITGEGLRPDPSRRKEELEQYPLDTLRMVGTLRLEEKTWALIQSQDGVIHRVIPGNHAGINHGQITHISDEKVELTEIVPDGEGNYRERQAILSLGSAQEQR